MNKIYVTDSAEVIEKIGKVEGVLFLETTLHPADDEIVCFIGSIIDKSEFYYRQLMNVKTKYITLVEDDIEVEKISNFWTKNSSIMSCREFRIKFEY